MSKSASSRVSLLVRAQDSLTARFPIRPRQLGHIPLKSERLFKSRIRCNHQTALSGGKVIKEENGKVPWYAFLHIAIITGRGKETMVLVVPDLVVPESFHGFISLSGTIHILYTSPFLPNTSSSCLCCTGVVMGPAIKSLGSTLSMPYGCGEQNMINFAPAVVIKRYLMAVGKLPANVDTRASHFMSIGEKYPVCIMQCIIV